MQNFTQLPKSLTHDHIWRSFSHRLACNILRGWSCKLHWKLDDKL